MISSKRFEFDFDSIDPKNTCVIYHGNCTDGLGGAYSAWKKLGDDATYIPYDYSKKPETLMEQLTDKNVIFIDVTFKRFEFLKVKDIAKTVCVLDHHPSAYDEIGDLDCCLFDNKRSGAMIAWNTLHPLQPVPKFITLIQDGDLWKFDFQETKWFYAAINENDPLGFSDLEKLENPTYLQKFIEKGKVLREIYENQVLEIASKAEPVRFMGHDIFMVEASRDYASEVGSLLAKKSGNFSLCYSDRAADGYKVSIRSIPNMDISLIASLFNGGGHPNASAFIATNEEHFYNILAENQDTLIPTKDEILELNKNRFEKSQQKKLKI